MIDGYDLALIIAIIAVAWFIYGSIDISFEVDKFCTAEGYLHKWGSHECYTIEDNTLVEIELARMDGNIYYAETKRSGK